MDTLLLSQAYEPLDRISWQRAITLWWMNKVEIIEAYEDRQVRSVSFAMQMPSVVRALGALRSRRHNLKFSRENVFTRDHGACQYCGEKLPRMEATWDHVVPRRLGGLTRWENVVLACVLCNQRKGGRTPEQAGMKLRSLPQRPRSLPSTLRLTFTEKKGMPVSWKQYLFDVQYWHGDLDES